MTQDKKELDNAKEVAMETIRTFFESLGFVVIDLGTAGELIDADLGHVTTQSPVPEDVDSWRHKLADAKLEDARRRAEIGKYDS